jgi:DnaJ-class molecular chaperone
MAGKVVKCAICRGTGAVPDKLGGAPLTCRTCCGTGTVRT